MTGKITPPELPPMQSSQPAAAPVPSAPAAAPRAQRASGTARLKQAVTYVAGGGIALVLAVCGGELVLTDGLKPSDLMATIEAQTEIAIMNQKLGFKRGEHVLTEAEYQEAITNAQRHGAARAEIAFQKELAVVQADKERVVSAYATLYQRANMIAQAALQLESLAQQFRQQLLEMSNGGRSMVIGIKDLFCGLGSEEACSSAHEDRRSMIAESDELSRGDVGAKVRELMAGVDDPATFVTHEDQKRHGTPTLDRR